MSANKSTLYQTLITFIMFYDNCLVFISFKTSISLIDAWSCEKACTNKQLHVFPYENMCNYQKYRK